MLLHFIKDCYNYPLLFIWSIFEGEVGLALAGSLTKSGQFRYEYILLVAILGASIGDISVFITGRVFKARAEHWLQHYRQRLAHIRLWLLRYGGWVLVFERFVFGTHIPALLLVGASDFPVWRFLLFDFIGVVLWAATFTTLGYCFGDDFVALLGIIQKHLNVILFAVIFYAATRWLYLRSKKGG
ncbi:MAG: DedA family protein [Deltaproteobacteria bacterium]|nr:DedA family protein [Deltaproteobacteria bacterium]